MPHSDDDLAASGPPTQPAARPEILVPGLRLVATSLGEVPQQALDPLGTWVEAILDAGSIVDWRLSASARRKGEVELIGLFDLWRRRWTDTTRLETVFNIVLLYELLDQLRPAGMGTTWSETVGGVIATGEPAVLEPANLDPFRADCEVMAHVIRERGATALGAIELKGEGNDASPPRTGLAAGWAIAERDRVVAADHAMSVVVAADGRLVARPSSARRTGISRDDGGLTDEVTVGEVTTADGAVVIDDPTVEDATFGTSTAVPARRARPLTWLVPGATSWRVREVPEVLIWAPTLSTLPDLIEEAAALQRRIRLSVDHPDPALSADPTTT